RLSSGIRRVSFLALSVGVFVATVPMVYGGDDQTVTPLKVVQQQPVAKTENQQALPSPAQAPNGNPDATAFASIAEREVSQLHEGITLAKWMDARGKGEHWEPTKPEMLVAGPDEECLSLRRTETLRHSPAEDSTSMPQRKSPTLLTRMSTRPKRSTTVLIS